MSLTLLSSSLLAHVPHAFSTRRGGVSIGPFDSLNFGNPGMLPPEHRDPPENIRENWRRAMAEIGVPGRALAEVHQVHGDAVHVLPRARAPIATIPDPRADALVTDDPAHVVAVRTADCAPVLIASTDGRVVAAVHAGWRGVIAGVAAAAVRAMHTLAPASCERGLAAAIGPCIGPDHFEVGPEVAAEFAAAFPSTPDIICPARADRSLIHLQLALTIQLRAAGITRIDTIPLCTYSRADLFFSHRLNAATGRMAAMISPVA